MRKVIAIILIGIIIFFSIYSVSNAADLNEEQETEESENKTLQEQQDELQEQIQTEEEELAELQKELTSNLLQLQELDAKIEEAKEEIEKLNEQINELEIEVNKIEVELETATEQYEKQKELYDARLGAMYESGEMKYLDILLQSQDILDFVSNYTLLQEMAEYDAIVLEEIATLKNEIEIEKAKLDKQTEQLGELKSNQTVSTNILENTIDIREMYISKLSEEEQQIQSDIDLYKAQFEAINNEILNLAAGSISPEYIGGLLEWPVPGYTRITSYYGMRDHPVTGVYKLHTGVDIGAPTGANFIAANGGIVTKAEYNSAYGNMVIIDHGGGVSTLYAHGAEIVVSVGQVVERGDLILRVGSTGYSTGPHAHFEVRINGVTVDPLPYITTGLEPEAEELE